MSHEITVRKDGFAEAVFNEKPAWHGLGTVVTGRRLVGTEAIEVAGLDWEVQSCPIAVGIEDDNTESVSWHELSSHQAMRRSDNGKILSVMSNIYKPIQNKDAFACLDGLVKEGEIEIEAAFSLNGGRNVCVLARAPGSIQITDSDVLLPYVLISTSHDGSETLLFGPTSVRVVCANTRRLAIDRSSLLSITHKGDVESRLIHARDMLVECGAQFFGKHVTIIDNMVNNTMTKDEREAFWTEALGGVLEDDATPAQKLARENALQAIRVNYAVETVARGSGDNLWTAYNAFSEVIDHAERRGKTEEARAETRFKVTQFGSGAKAKDRAWKTAAGMLGVRCK